MPKDSAVPALTPSAAKSFLALRVERLPLQLIYISILLFFSLVAFSLVFLSLFSKFFDVHKAGRTKTTCRRAICYYTVFFLYYVKNCRAAANGVSSQFKFHHLEKDYESVRQLPFRCRRHPF